MSSEINAERARQAQELRDLQDSYRKRKQEVDAEGARELEKTRHENSTKIRDEASTGEAAINHLRTDTKEKIEQARTENERRLTYERKNLGQRLSNQQQHGQEQVASVKESFANKEQNLRKNLSDLQKRENDLRMRESQMTNVIGQEQSQRRAQIMKQDQQELMAFNKKVQEQKTEVTDKSRREMNALNEQHRKELSNLRNQHQETYNKQLQGSQAQLKAQHEGDAARIEVQRKEHLKNVAALSERADKTMREEQDRDIQQLKKMRVTNDAALEQERSKGTTNMEKTRERYDKNIADINRKGDEKVAQETILQERKMRLLEQENKDEFQKQQVDHQDRMHNDETVFKHQSETARAYYKDALVQQHQEYDEAFKKNMESFAEQVKNQREMLQTSLMREKKEVMHDMGKFNAKKHDPFYRMNDPKAQLKETENHYIVQARVPEHEKDNVRVSVQEDKVVVLGQRAFNDKLEDESGKYASNSYQSYRQEIPLEHPVRDKHAVREYANGILTVKIPKA